MQIDPKKVINLFDEASDAVDVVFGGHRRFGGVPSSTAPTYAYRAPKSMNLQPGDMVVVPAQKAMEVAQVVQVRPVYELADHEDEIPMYKEVVQRVDTADFDRRTENNAKFATVVEGAMRQAAKKSYCDQFRAAVGEAACLAIQDTLMKPRE